MEVKIDASLPLTSEAIQEELARVMPQVEAAEESLGQAIIRSALAEKQGDAEGMKQAEKMATAAQEKLWPLRARRLALEERQRALEKERRRQAEALRKEDLESNLLPMVPKVNQRAKEARAEVVEAGRLLLSATQEFLDAQTELGNLKSVVQPRCFEFGIAPPAFESLSWGELYVGKLRLSDFFANLGSKVPERRVHRISPLSQVRRMAGLAAQKNGHQ